MPKFSVLLPTHNRADVVGFAVRSVLAQTTGDWELLVVGDGCTDGTATVMREFTDPRIKWFDFPKARGFGYANRNVALRQARGAFIAYMAHDDLWLADHLEMAQPALARPGIELVYTRPLWVLPRGVIVPGTFNLEIPRTLQYFLDKMDNMPSTSVVHRRACFEKYGYWNEALERNGDSDMWSRIIVGGGKRNFAVIGEPTTFHFKANWRTKEEFVAYRGVWEHFYEKVGLPAALQFSVPEGTPEQAVLWQRLAERPEACCQEVRSAVRQVLDMRINDNNRQMAWLLRHKFWWKLARKVSRLFGG